MLKVNYYRLLFLTSLFCVNNASIRVFSFNTGDSNSFSSGWDSSCFDPNASSSVPNGRHHIRKYYDLDNTTNSTGGVTPSVVSQQQQQFTNEANSIAPLFPNYTTEMSGLNSPSSTTFLADQYLKNSHYLRLAAALKNGVEEPDYYNPCSSTNPFACIHNTNLLMEIDDNDSDDDHFSNPSDMVDTSPDTVNNQVSSSIVHEASNMDTSSNTNNRLPLSPEKTLPNKHESLEKEKQKKRTEKPFKCKICQKELSTKGGFEYHLNAHNNRKPYNCKECKKSFRNKSRLKEHSKLHKDPKPYKCPNDSCTKAYTTKEGLKYHIKTHNNEKPFSCAFCSKRFKTNFEKITHHFTHAGEKPFKCHICQKGLSTKGGLEYHLNTHNNRKPYNCKECKKSFRNKSRLKEHSKLHKDPKPYKCPNDSCTKAYTTKEGLKYHIETHNRTKLYTCSYCSVDFAHKSEYDNHMRYEEGTDEDLKCHICKRAYTEKYNLIRHNKKAHPKT